MNKPLISIIMPAYNASAYIQEAVTSVIEQTYTHWELLIVNDGSTDDTEERVKAIEDPRIRYFSQVNQGVSAARNKALAQMNGEYFCFLDADDSFPEKSLEVRVSAFQQDPTLSFVDGQVLIMDHSMAKVIDTKNHSFKGNPFNALIRLDESCFFGLSWMIKRNPGVLYQFREKLTHGEDLLFFITICKLGGRYTAVDKLVLLYRQGHHSAMRNLRGLEKSYLELYRILDEEIRINGQQRSFLKKKFRSIMWKSYLADLSPVKALRAYLRFSSL